MLNYYGDARNHKAVGPLISVLMPVYNVEEKWLRICIESVTNQIYENWEFCIADDASPAPHIKKVLESSWDRKIENGRLGERPFFFVII